MVMTFSEALGLGRSGADNFGQLRALAPSAWSVVLDILGIEVVQNQMAGGVMC
jgi:hypothetical protein